MTIHPSSIMVGGVHLPIIGGGDLAGIIGDTPTYSLGAHMDTMVSIRGITPIGDTHMVMAILI